MSFLISAQQFFFIVILVFAVIGFQRGWKKELVSLGCSLGVILFLSLGGGKGLAHFFFVSMPAIFQIAVSTSGAAPHPSTSGIEASANDILLTTLLTFALVIIAGYYIGNKAFPGKVTAAHERLLGILPAMISGSFLMFYVTQVLAKSPLFTLGVNTPNQNQVGNSVFVVFLIALGVAIAALFAASARKKK